jgi:nicotinamide mononucleotide transporter PnuC
MAKLTGVVLGSFSPLHRGHLDLILKAKKECSDGVVIAVCGYRKDKGEEVGLPLSLRRELIERAFKYYGYHEDPLVNVIEMDDNLIGIAGYNNHWKEWLAEFGEYIFYNATMIYGIYVWKKNLEDGSKSQVVGKKMSVKAWIYSIAATVIATVGFGLLDNYVFKGAVPYLDAFTISFTVIAQILMVLCYRDQWVFWFILDIASIATFAALKNLPLMTMYVAWTINCVYGWIEWSKKNNG